MISTGGFKLRSAEKERVVPCRSPSPTSRRKYPRVTPDLEQALRNRLQTRCCRCGPGRAFQQPKVFRPKAQSQDWTITSTLIRQAKTNFCALTRAYRGANLIFLLPLGLVASRSAPPGVSAKAVGFSARSIRCSISKLSSIALGRFYLPLRSLGTSVETVEKLPVGFEKRLYHTLRMPSIDRECLGGSDDNAPNCAFGSDDAKPSLLPNEG